MKYFGDYTKEALMGMTPEQLIQVILDRQMEDNFILMTDSYKMTHWALLPPGLKEMYSYLESRGGDMQKVVFFGLQYYLKKYMCGVRITPEKIAEAHDVNIKHFGFDCFDRQLWTNIVERHGGRLPLEIKAVPEGTVMDIRNVMMTVRNTDHDHCAQLTGITETLLMKVWATCTVASYALTIMEEIRRGWRETSDIPEFLLKFLHHDFGYRGCSSEESARLLSAAAMVVFEGTDTLGGIKLLRDYYHCEMAGYSVIASEHSVVCSFGPDDDDEFEYYRNAIQEVIRKFPHVTIISLVADTNNVWRSARVILPKMREFFHGVMNADGLPIKVVLRPDSGSPLDVLFGFTDAGELKKQLEICESRGHGTTAHDLRIGVFGILFEEFGSRINSKGYKTFLAHEGLLQGDGVNRELIKAVHARMEELKIDKCAIVFGSGGKYLQFHDRDEMKFAIKATHIVDAAGDGRAIKKNPVTDSGKASKSGYLKLTFDGKVHRTISSLEDGYDEAEDILRPVFLNGELLVDQTMAEVRTGIAEYFSREEAA